MKLRTSLVALTLLITSCTSMPGSNGKPMPRQTFDHVAPLYLAVSDIFIEEPQDKSGKISGFVVDMNKAVLRYFGKKLQATGGARTMTIAIEKSSVTHSFEESSNSVAGFLGVAGFDVYNVELVLNLKANDSFGSERGVRLSAGRVIKISEHASIAERERHQLDGIEVMMKEIDAQVTKIVFQDLGIGANAPATGGWNNQGSGAPTQLAPQVDEWGEPVNGPASNGAIERQAL